MSGLFVLLETHVLCHDWLCWTLLGVVVVALGVELWRDKGG